MASRGSFADMLPPLNLQEIDATNLTNEQPCLFPVIKYEVSASNSISELMLKLAEISGNDGPFKLQLPSPVCNRTKLCKCKKCGRVINEDFKEA